MPSAAAQQARVALLGETGTLIVDVNIERFSWQIAICPTGHSILAQLRGWYGLKRARPVKHCLLALRNMLLLKRNRLSKFLALRLSCLVAQLAGRRFGGCVWGEVSDVVMAWTCRYEHLLLRAFLGAVVLFDF